MVVGGWCPSLTQISVGGQLPDPSLSGPGSYLTSFRGSPRRPGGPWSRWGSGRSYRSREGLSS